MSYNINDVYALVKKQANQSGASSNITPNQFNEFWKRAELKFFNNEYERYAASEVISDSISKWMSPPLLIPIDATGNYTFFNGMNLLHVDSVSAFLTSTGTSIATLGSNSGGAGYTDGTYTIPLTGGTGTGATGSVTVLNGNIQSVLLIKQGSGYVVGDTLNGTITGGTFTVQVATLTGSTIPQDIKRVEKDRWAANISSSYDAPTQEFGIYTQFSNSLLFAPANMGFASLIYLQQPVASYWGYNMQGWISTLTGLVGGTSYTTGIYTNVPLTGGLGNGALATIVVAGSVVTSVTVTAQGKLYAIGDVLSASAANIGGTGTGFHISVSSLVAGTIRAVYNPSTSVQPLWNDYDISQIVMYALIMIGIKARDNELLGYAEKSSQEQQ